MSVDNLEVRYLIQARLLGQDKEGKKRGREKEYAIQVTLSDESQYTMFRTLKDIGVLHSRLMSRFPIEAGYFKKNERLIPECPVKQTVFGPQRVIRDDRSFEKLLNSYIKEIPGLPASVVKCDLVSKFFSLRVSDISLPGSPKRKNDGGKKKKKNGRVVATENSTITGPVSLRSYYTVADYTDKKTKFTLSEGSVVQVMKKDPGGWWMVDCRGSIGWAPASYLVPVDTEDLQDEAEENAQLIEPEKVGARYISISNYQSSRDDELSFVRGAVVKVIKKYVDGWWLVRYNGGEGYVPGALFRKFDRRQASVYVRKIRRNFISRKSTKIIPTIKPKWMNTPGRSNGKSTGAKCDDKPGLVLYQCKAIFEGAAERFELCVNKNDTVKVVDKQDHGWWYVEDNHGRSGWVPASYLRPLLDKERTRVTNGEKIIGSVYDALQDHTATQEDELNMKKGDMVEVVMVSVDGWWAVRNTVTKAQGLVPSVCLTLEGENGLDNIIEEEESINSLTSQSEPTISLNYREVVSDVTSVSSGAVDRWAQSPDEGSLDDLEEADNDLDLEGCFVAIGDYTKEAIDELDLFEGQVVCVIDDSDKDVWYVNCDGKEGWVPANLLREFVDDAMQTSGESTPMSASSAGMSSDDSDMDGEFKTKLSNSISPPRSYQRNGGMRRHSSQESSPTKLSPQPQKKHSAPARNGGVSHYSSQDSPQPPKRHPVPARNGGMQRTVSADSNNSGSLNSPVIMVDNRSLEELEREVAAAERKVLEARKLASQLKQRVKVARSLSSADDRSPSPNK